MYNFPGYNSACLVPEALVSAEEGSWRQNMSRRENAANNRYQVADLTQPPVPNTSERWGWCLLALLIDGPHLLLQCLSIELRRRYRSLHPISSMNQWR